MAVIHVGTRPQRSGRVSARKNNLLYETLGRRYVRPIIVITNHPADGPNVILKSPLLTAAGCSIGSTYQFGNDIDAVATCVDVNVDETDNPFIWYGMAEYDTDRLVSAVTDNPLNQPAIRRWTSSKYARPLTRDLYGIPVVNTSREVFDPPFEYEDTRPVLLYTRNEGLFDSSMIATYQDAVNADVWNGNSPYLVKLNSINAQDDVINGVPFSQVTYEFEFRREGFWLYALDQGYRDILKQLFRDPRDFTPYSNPTLLNGRGKALFDAKSKIQAVALTATATTFAIDGNDMGKFPPGPKDGTPHWYFNVKIDDEVMTVISGFNSANWTVLRGQGGTTAAAHALNADVLLEPYYLRFMPFKVLSFAPLGIML